MANNPTVFTDEAEFNAAALPVNFDPVIAPDVTPLMEKNQQTTINNFKRAQEQGNKNIEWENTWAKFADDRNVAQLEKFSETLTNIANIGAKKIIEKQEAEGEALAHSQGAAHIAAIEKNVAGDTERAIEGQALANDLGAAAENDGGSTEIVQSFENLGAYAKVAYTNQLLQTAGNNYSQWREGEEAQKITVQVPDGQGGMKHVNLQSASNSAEIAAITTEVKKQYLQKYKGLGTLTGRNKYLWQKMDEHETAVANQRGEQMRQARDNERKAEINNQMIEALKNGPESAKEKLEELTKLWGGRYTPQGLIDNVMVGLGKALDTDQISGEDMEALLDMEIYDKSVKKNIKLRDSVVYRNALRKNGITNKIEDQKNRVVNRHTNLIKRETFKLEQSTLQAIRKAEADKGAPISEEELRDFINAWKVEAKKPNSNLGPIPESITDYLTAEDMAEENAKALADWNINKYGYLPQDIADTLPYAVRNKQEYKSVTKTRQFAMPSTTNQNNAVLAAKGVANKRYDTEYGEKDSGSVNYQRFWQRALEQYNINYAQNKLAGMNDRDANTEAIKQMERDGNNKVYDKDIKPSYAKRDTGLYIEGSKHLKANKNNFSSKIPGLDTNGNKDKGILSTIERLEKIASGESYQLPQVFTAIGADYKPINGVPAGWALAAAQYKAYTGEDLPLPTAMAQTQGMEPYIEQMLNYRSTTARSNRAIVTLHPKSEVKPNDKSESKLEGDANNDGKIDQDDLLSIIADKNADDLSGRTINEVLVGIDTGNLHTVGLYGMTKDQLNEALQDTGIDPSTEFTPAIQNQLILSRIRSRLRADNSLAGLRERFPSLSTINQKTFDQYTALINPTTPFNDANSGNVHSGLVTNVGK